MKTITDNRRKPLLKKYHTLCGKLGLEDYEKLALVGVFGVQSSADLTVPQLIEVCNRLEVMMGKQLQGRDAELDKLRKRLIAAIGAWCRATNKIESIELIKAIACRAAFPESEQAKERIKGFNNISPQKLRSLYAAFTKMKGDLMHVDELTAIALMEARLN